MRRSGTRPARATGTSAPTPPAEDPSLLAVDAALSMASQRSVVTSVEAIRLLHEVHASIELERSASIVDQIVREAAGGFAGRELLDRDLVVDPLLDIRLAIRE